MRLRVLGGAQLPYSEEGLVSLDLSAPEATVLCGGCSFAFGLFRGAGSLTTFFLEERKAVEAALQSPSYAGSFHCQ